MATVNTPYATICTGDPDLGWKGCGRQYMTQQQYNQQMSRPDSTWRCVCCGMEAEWDDDNYEEHMGIDSSENDNEEVAF